MRTMASCGRIVSSVTWNLFWERWVFSIICDTWKKWPPTADLNYKVTFTRSTVKSLLCCWQREKRVLGHIAIVTARCQWLRKKILQAWDRQRQVRVNHHESWNTSSNVNEPPFSATLWACTGCWTLAVKLNISSWQLSCFTSPSL